MGRDLTSDTLSGTKVALVGLPAAEAQTVRSGLERAEAFVHVLDYDSGRPTVESMGRFDAVVVRAGRMIDGTPEWVSTRELNSYGQPTLVCAPRDFLAAVATGDDQAPRIPDRGIDLLLLPLDIDELLLRLTRLVTENDRQDRQPAPHPAKDRPPTVALVDDDPTVTRLVEVTLRNYGFEVHSASAGEAGVTLVTEIVPDVLVLDLGLPDLDGFEVLTRIKMTAATTSVQVLILSASHEETDVFRAFQLGAQDYITKPFNPLELVARVRRLCGS